MVMEVPSGVEIARWFREEHGGRLGAFQGYDGLDLVREGNDYCYVWLEAYVDFDLTGYFLLDVRTSIGDEPFSETRDFLFVSTRDAVEWHGQPIRFAATPFDHGNRFVAGMTWFTQRILLDLEWDLPTN